MRTEMLRCAPLELAQLLEAELLNAHYYWTSPVSAVGKLLSM